MSAFDTAVKLSAVPSAIGSNPSSGGVDEPPVVAMTFDAEHPDRAGLGPATCERILEALDEGGVRATFFFQGRWVEAHPELARGITAAGHLVGSHSHYHAPMPLLTRAGVREDVLRAEAAIREVTGVDPRPWFRSPFGAGIKNRRLDACLRELGYVNVPWDVDGADWESTQTSGAIANAIVEGSLRGQKARIVLLHSWPEQAAAAVPEILTRLAKAGATFVTVDAIRAPTNDPFASVAGPRTTARGTRRGGDTASPLWR
ncbi:MAG TPA: polysaccharide deacetylase family protein [Candidatus Dormibacteraeota bacterium]|nr:polysaccharide deacetylase family protein [Candidatus Dormibacteraeota bacterium]